MTSPDVLIRLRGDPSSLLASLQVAKSNVAAFASEVEKSAQKRQALTQLGTASGGVGLAAAVAGPSPRPAGSPGPMGPEAGAAWHGVEPNLRHNRRT